MKTACAILVAICSAVLLYGTEPNVIETWRLANSLDELVRQRSPAQVVESPGRWKRGATPVPLKRVVPLAADMLKIERAELAELLREDREKLSEIVYARVLGEKQQKPWRSLLINGQDLFAELQKENVPLAAVHSILENLYTELSFASLDGPAPGNRK